MADESPALDSLFLAALNIASPQERANFLQQACGDNVELRAQVELLLKSHEQAGSFLEFPAPEIQATANDDRIKSLEADRSATFAAEQNILVGGGQHSVLQSLGQTMDVPRVVLRDPRADGPEPIVRPTSLEMPQRESDCRYQLQGEIARGGMGAILRGRDTDLGRELAIKVLLDEHKEKPEVIQRFIEEAQIGGQLQHPGIAPVYELGQFSDKRPYFSMKLVKGETLSKLLAQRRDPTEDRMRFLGIFEQVCQTMAYAHSRGVIHRDLKPANIMVGSFGEVQVMDWGLAKVLSAGGVADEKKAHDAQVGKSIIQTLRSVGSDVPAAFGTYGSPTVMGSVLGTPAYMPPEQALGEIDNLDERADVFGLGAILCEMLTGKPPYVADEGEDVFRMACRGKLNDCFQRLDVSHADEDLIKLAKHCLELEPANRPRDAGVLVERVTAYLESVEQKLQETELARVDTQARAEESARRHRLAIGAGAAILVTLVIGVAVSGWHAMRATRAEKSALTALDELRATAPAFAEQARSLAAKEEFDEAIAKLNYAMTLRPDNPDYLVAKGDLLQCQLRLAEAAAVYRDALRLAPGLARAEQSAQLCEELLWAKRTADGQLTRESLAKLYLAMQRQQRPAAELMPVARLMGDEKKLLVDYWLTRLKDLPVSPERPLAERLTVRDDGRLALDLSNTKVIDLAPLAGAPLATLDISSSEGLSELSDLAPLRGLELIELNISMTSVIDLAPLNEMRTLTRLEMSGSNVSELSELSALRLQRLHVNGCPISDITPIRGLPLTELSLYGTRVADLSPLIGMPIKHLELGRIPAVDFSPLANLPLETCIFDQNGIRDLSVLRGKQLKELVLAGCNQARNYSAIAEMETLELLVLPLAFRTLPEEDYAAIASLRELPNLRQLASEAGGRMGYASAGVSRLGIAEPENFTATAASEIFWQHWDDEQTFLPALRKSGFNFWIVRLPSGTYAISMYHQAISDLSMIRGAPISELLIIGGGQLSDLTPLEGMPLTLLNIPNNPVSDLSPLRGMPLERIFLTGTQVRDLSPLVGLPIKALYLGNCRDLTDIAPLAEIPSLEHLIIPTHVTNVDVLRKLPRLQRLGYKLTGNQPMLPETTVEEFWREYDKHAWGRSLQAMSSIMTAPKRLEDGTWEVNLSKTAITDLSQLRSAPISRLNIDNTQVSDLTPLRGLPLTTLRLSNTKVTDLSPLQGMPLELLVLRGTKAADLSPLRGMPLKTLLLFGCREITDLSPLSECRELEAITLPPNARNVELLRALPKLQRISLQEDVQNAAAPDKTATEFWRAFDALKN